MQAVGGLACVVSRDPRGVGRRSGGFGHGAFMPTPGLPPRIGEGEGGDTMRIAGSPFWDPYMYLTGRFRVYFTANMYFIVTKTRFCISEIPRDTEKYWDISGLFRAYQESKILQMREKSRI